MASENVFSGNLNFFGLGDLIQLIGSHGSTGVLTITSKYATEPGKIFFAEGNPIDAICLSKSGIDALYSLFGWTQGDFEFSLQTVKRKPLINESRMQIILSGLKMFDDGEIDKLGPFTIEKTSMESSVLGIPQPIVKGPLIDYTYVLDEEEFPADSDIVLEGKHGNWLWVILEGTVQIKKDIPDGKINIVRIGPGSFVGSIASFLLGDYVRSATVLAVDRVLLGILDSHRLSIEFASLSPELRNILLSMDRRLKQVTDRTLDYYHNENPLNKLNKFDTYISQGEKNNKVVMIKEGKACVVRKTNSGEVLLSNLFPGDFIGRVPFIEIDHEPTLASVYCSKNLVVEEIKMDAVVNEYKKLTPTFNNIIDNISSSMAATSIMACEFFKKHKKNGSI